MSKKQKLDRNIQKNALRDINLSEQIASLTPEEIFSFVHNARKIMFWGIKNPVRKNLLSLKDSLPILDRFVEFDIVLKRLKTQDQFKHTPFGVDVHELLPELVLLQAILSKQIQIMPQGINKAELWLMPIAQHAEADADIEAAVYLASRGKITSINRDALKEAWRLAICKDIERGYPLRNVSDNIRERAHKRTLSLPEAAETLKHNKFLFRFFSFRDEEEDFIDATMARAIEWLELSDLEPWLEAFISDISIGPQNGIEDNMSAGWWLFHWCRSDLALRLAERLGLDAWLWALLNGQIERDKPWQVYSEERGNAEALDLLSFAGIILFVGRRIGLGNIKEEILQNAANLLLQTQLSNGAWATTNKDTEPSLLATCVAIHGLALQRPNGWEKVVTQAAAWIEAQQHPNGFWDIEGGPTVMLTVLALDSMALARDSKQVTFKIETTLAQGKRKTTPLKIFICHSSNDKASARKIYKQLLEDGFLPWLDEENLLPGQDWQQEIIKAVRNSDVVIVCLSNNSISKSGYVQKEIKYALDVADEKPDGTIFLIPLKLEECQIPYRLSKLQWVDFNSENGYKKLKKALQIRSSELGN